MVFIIKKKIKTLVEMMPYFSKTAFMPQNTVTLLELDF